MSHVAADDGARLFLERTGEGATSLLVLNAFYLFEDFTYLAETRSVAGLDLRNRGRSEPIEDAARLARGVEQDADDLEAWMGRGRGARNRSMRDDGGGRSPHVTA